MKSQTHKILALLALVGFGQLGCLDQATEPMPDIPETVEYDTVKIKYGDDDLLGVPQEGTRMQMLVGDLSPFSVLTRGVVKSTNTMIRDQLQLVENFTKQRPTDYDDGLWIWEYTTTQGHLYFEIEELEASRYRYEFRAGTVKADAEEIFNGEFVRRERLDGRQQGFGKIRFFFDAYKKLNPTSPDGTIVIAFRAGEVGREVRVGLFDFRPFGEEFAESALYTYQQIGDAGRFKFSARTDWLNDGEPLERTTLDVGWTQDQAGKVAVRLTGGSLEVDEVLLTECWDEAEITTYADSTPDLPAYEGGDEALCAAPLGALNLEAPTYTPLTDEPEVPEAE